MITGTEIYWITRLDDLRTFLFALGGVSVGVCAIGTVVSIVVHAINAAEAPNLLPISKKYIIRFLPCLATALFVLLSACFVPTTKQMCAIKVLPAIINNEDVQELPNKVVDLASEWLEELKPNKETNK